MREQDDWDGHAAFMDELADAGVIVLGGPIGEGAHRVLLVVDADSPEAVRAVLAGDPWVSTGHLEIESIEPWQILLRAPDR
jgi:uncharacterized protein YciI